VNFQVLVKQKSIDAINELPKKSRKIIFDALKGLEENPWPGGNGDKEKLHLKDELEMYRLHIGRRYTAWYTIHGGEHAVKIHDVMTIEQAHKKYGRL
jgi:mRNA-degrading endonuclease RelE of RelBE toxin-antitoxin system